MINELKSKQREHWVKEEISVLENPETYDLSPKNAWKRMRIRKSGQQYLAILATLCHWREKRAQKLDKPRQHILRDNVIYDIADQELSSVDELSKLRSIPLRLPEHQLKILADAVAEAIASPKKFVQEAPAKKVINSDSFESSSELLKVLLKHVSEKYGVVPRIIADAPAIEQIARGDRFVSHTVFTGWRNEVFGQKARDLLAGKIGMSLENGKVRLFNI